MVKRGKMKKRIIARVRASKRTGQKTITIPKKCRIHKGEYVEIRRMR